MDEVIELIVEAEDGIIDIRLEPQRIEGDLFYTATILYPNIVNGYSRSEIFCYDLIYDTETGNYHLEASDNDIHPKIRKLEQRISHVIRSAR
jgi:hypothetical protein